MDSNFVEESLDLEDNVYQALSPNGPTRARRRQSDAKWRASVATCYDTLKHVVPKGHRASKRKVSKAVILQESERHIMHLESVLSRMIGSESQAKGKAVLWKGDSQWAKSTLKHFQDDFAERQHKIFHSSNQGRRCYNLLDEIKEEIFSMTVDPNNISVVDKESVSVTKCVDKVNGKEVSRFSQMPDGHVIKKETLTVINPPVRPEFQQYKQHKHWESCSTEHNDSLESNEIMARYFDRENQIVPSLRPSLTPSTLDTPSQMFAITPTLSFDSLKGKSDSMNAVHFDLTEKDGSSVLMCLDNDGDEDDGDRDQEVPSFEITSTVVNNEMSEDCPANFLSKVSNMDYSVEKMGDCHNTESHFLGSSSSVSSNPAQNVLKDEDLKTPGNKIHPNSFKTKCLESSTLLRSLTHKRKDQANKPKTARKLNFNKPECVGVHQKLSEQRELHHYHHHKSPMLADFTPIKMSPNVSSCVTCKQPNESLVSPWKPFHSPLSEQTKKEKSPMIDPENSLFCFEPTDSILDNKNDTQDEKFFDLGVFKSKHSISTSDCSKLNTFTSASDDAQVVPDLKTIAASDTQHEEREEERKEERNDDESGVTLVGKHNEDAVDFDGFFFYFRQIGQQLKDQQKLSNKEIQSPSVAAKVMKMWMRLPSPDKQTIKTLALLDSQVVCPTMQDGVGSLSQDLQDVDVKPIDLKEFIPTTPV